jgi:hypothetical protein
MNEASHEVESLTSPAIDHFNEKEKILVAEYGKGTARIELRVARLSGETDSLTGES